jgi:primosomal protein N' (replication factor Y) (superfamily II helicase)
VTHRHGAETIICVVVDAPVAHGFDYLLPTGVDAARLTPGVRVRVPFGRRERVGVLVAVQEGSRQPAGKLRRAYAVLDEVPVLDGEMLALLTWTASYYQHPLGQVIAAALPVALRAGADARATEVRWRATVAGAGIDLETLRRRAARQADVLARVRGAPEGLTARTLAESGGASVRPALAALAEKGWVERAVIDAQPEPRAGADAGSVAASASLPELTEHQRVALAHARAALDRFQCFLLNGITGSGKTEIYLRLAADVLEQGRQVLVLVPEISLTPQLVDRFRARLAAPVHVLHSGLADGERLATWKAARAGRARVVLGTRSAVFTPLCAPGLIVVDEEHDPSFKQQEGFHYHARDVAVVRARRLGVPIMLGSATPALETIHNVASGRYRELRLPERAGGAIKPEVRLVDLRVVPARGGLSAPMLAAMRRHLDRGAQVLVFINRRGYAPAWFCARCGWSAQCDRCDARLTWHRSDDRLHCHHCGAERARPPRCPECGEPALPAGQGTERVAETLAACFPDAPLARIDRDSTRGRGSLQALLGDVRSGTTRILVGTQMLTKGHDFPDVTMVGVLNADQGLFGTDFRSAERLAQILVQVSGRAGRAERPGEVFIQTAYPEHPLLQRLVTEGYESFAHAALAERRSAGWPPWCALAVLRAEAADARRPFAFLEHAGAALAERGRIRVLGPAPAAMPRRAGRHRAQLVLQADGRPELQRALAAWVPVLDALPDARRVRWSLDVDPLEL